MKEKWSGIIVVLLVGVGIGYFTARWPVQNVQAQSASSVPGVAVVLGEQYDEEVPVVVVDPLAQTLMVYQYDYDRLKLEAVRSYRYDRKLSEFDNSGLSVRDVMERLQ
jgi:ABC-type phosphate transport system auxiliary subunit